MEQFGKQMKKGSKWETRDMKHPGRRWKKTSAHLELSDEQIEKLYRYIHGN